jgi:hypothetical protein
LAPLNKVHHVYTITRAAELLGEDETWLWEISMDMEPEDGCLWVFDTDDKETIAFTDFGIENLKALVDELKSDPRLPNQPRH